MRPTRYTDVIVGHTDHCQIAHMGTFHVPRHQRVPFCILSRSFNRNGFTGHANGAGRCYGGQAIINPSIANHQSPLVDRQSAIGSLQ